MVDVSKRIGLVAFLLAAAAPLGSVAQDATAPSGIVVSLDYSKGEFSSEFVEFVAKYGARAPVAFSADKPLRIYVTEVCGFPSKTNENLFTLAIAGDGGAVAADGSIRPAAGATDLMLPSCLPSPAVELTPRIAVKDTTFYNYFKTDNGGADLFGSDVVAQTSLPQLLDKMPSFNRTPLELPPLSFDTNDTTQLESYVNSTVNRLVAMSTTTDKLAFDAFLTANDLVQGGSDPVAVSDAFKNSFSNVGRSLLGEQLAVALPETLKRYQGYSSDQWAKVLTQPIVPDVGTFTDQIQWLDPKPRERRGEDLQVGHVALVPTLKAQTANVIIDPARLPASSEDMVAFVQKKVANATVPAEVMLLETQGIDAVQNSQCDGAVYREWQTQEFAQTFADAIKRSRESAEKRGVHFSDTQIVVIDSGFVRAADLGAFSPRLSVSGAMLDDEEASKSLGDRRNHGTAVAGVAIGGPLLGSLMPELVPEIAVTPRRIYKDYVVSGTVVPQVDWDRMYSAIQSDGDIFNLSFATTNKRNMEEFRPYLGPIAAKLFVVAAGNNNMNFDDRGVDIDVTSLYPQLFSDESAIPNLITVAAYDGTTRAWFSNFSDRRVSIAAPGCSIASWVPDTNGSKYVQAKFAGTSFAAPIVSYVAAVVHSLLPSGYKAPIWVRSRILASADLVDGLSGVVDGRLLNPIKAAAVYEDYIELDVGKSLKGQLGAVNIQTLCDAPGLTADSAFMKFARLPQPRGGKDSVVYFLRDRELQHMDCNHKTGLLGLSTDTGNVAVAIETIRDLVPRMVK